MVDEAWSDGLLGPLEWTWNVLALVVGSESVEIVI